MAVAFDAGSESHTGATGSISEASFNWNHIPVLAPQAIVIFVVNLSQGTTYIAGTVTYDGKTIPEDGGMRANDNAGEPGTNQTFFLGEGIPTTNPANIVVNRVNNTDELWAVAISLTANARTERADSVVGLQGDGTLAEQSIQDFSPGTNSLRLAGGFSGLGTPPAAGTNSTAVHSFDTGNQTAAVVRETTAGQGSRPVGFSSGTTDDRAIIHFAIREILKVPYVNPMPPLIAQ